MRDGVDDSSGKKIVMSTEADADREQRLDEAVLAYLKAREGNPHLDQQSWIEQYPELKDDLADFFRDQNRIDKLATLLRMLTDTGETPANNEVTLTESKILACIVLMIPDRHWLITTCQSILNEHIDLVCDLSTGRSTNT